jgi:hypothetical protein
VVLAAAKEVDLIFEDCTGVAVPALAVIPPLDDCPFQRRQLQAVHSLK